MKTTIVGYIGFRVSGLGVETERPALNACYLGVTQGPPIPGGGGGGNTKSTNMPTPQRELHPRTPNQHLFGYVGVRQVAALFLAQAVLVKRLGLASGS